MSVDCVLPALVAYVLQNPFVMTALAAGAAVAILYAERLLSQKLSARRIPRRVWICEAVLVAVTFVIFTGGLTSLRYLTYSSPNYDFGIFVTFL